MARSTDPKKVALWQERFRRFVDSGVPVARFCAAEQVSQSTFFYWQKKLGVPGRGRATRAEDRAAGCERRRAIPKNQNVFRPVTVVRATCDLVVRLPGGARIEVDASQLDTIRAVVAEMVRADHDQTTQQNRPSASRVIRKRGDVRQC